MRFEIDDMTEKDYPDVAEIYRHGIETGLATIDTEPSTWAEWDGAHLESCRLVAVMCGQVVGWVALEGVSHRCAYRGAAEVSVYVRKGCRGAGFGTALLKALIAESEEAGIRTLQSRLFPDNAAGLALHGKCGFREVGLHKRMVGANGRRRDVVVLERRSDSVGAD